MRRSRGLGDVYKRQIVFCLRSLRLATCQWQRRSMSATRDYPALDSFPSTGTPVHQKLSGYDLYRKLGSPKRIVAPMVEHSELPWRILSRRHGAELIYSPMINAKIYAQNNRGAHRVREGFFNREFGEEGAHELKIGDKNDTDRPLIVQFCANDPDPVSYTHLTLPTKLL